MSTPTDDASRAQAKADNKDYGRDDRLSFRKFAEHKMKREFKKVAIKKCEVHLKNFGQCAQDNGLLVVFKCRDFNRKINECMAEHNSPGKLLIVIYCSYCCVCGILSHYNVQPFAAEAFQRYLEENKDELDKRTIKSPEGSIR